MNFLFKLDTSRTGLVNLEKNCTDVGIYNFVYQDKYPYSKNLNLKLNEKTASLK